MYHYLKTNNGKKISELVNKWRKALEGGAK